MRARLLPKTILISMFLAVTVTSCTPAPAGPATCPAKTTSAANGNAAVFGVPESKLGRVVGGAATAAASGTTLPSSSVAGVNMIRGGDTGGGVLHEPETLADVEALVTNAGSHDRLVVIDFTASWCGPCKAIAPLYKELSEEYDNVVFLKVDVDENPDTAAKYSVSAMPTFVYIRRGRVVDRLQGANPIKLREMIEEHMGA
jgi:thioredoxin 1